MSKERIQVPSGFKSINYFVALLFVCLSLQAPATEMVVVKEKEKLVALVKEVKGYFNGAGKCIPKFDLKDRKYLIEAMLASTDSNIMEGHYFGSNAVDIIIKSKIATFGIDIELENGKCKKFYVSEIVQ